MAELFEEKLTNGRQVISIDDVTAVIKIMGSPEEYRIGSDSSDEQEGETIRPKKRIFRDPDNRIIGGVAGGLGAYFGLDPILFRAVFLILLWTGSGVIAYPILMLVIPRAKTTAQRLQMRGEAVNLSNIERSVSDELKKAGQIIDDQTERLRKRGFFDNAGKMARTIADFIGNILQLIAKAILRILSVALIILGGFLLLVVDRDRDGRILRTEWYFIPCSRSSSEPFRQSLDLLSSHFWLTALLSLPTAFWHSRTDPSPVQIAAHKSADRTAYPWPVPPWDSCYSLFHLFPLHRNFA